MGKKTPFYQLHEAHRAKIVDFAGWDMPLHYGSQLNEHHQVRKQAGFFDVSHMGIVDLHGAEATAYLRYLLANDVARLVPGKALYSCMLNEQGGVLDDLIVYQRADHDYRIVINAGTRDKDLAWMREHAKNFKVELTERDDLAMLAIQGPAVKDKLPALFKDAALTHILALKPFHFYDTDDCFIARTGYTGEDGYEWIFPAKAAKKIWAQLIESGMLPCGLGARDTLRLEAGLNLYGLDMDEAVSPLESNLAWTVVMEPKERHFIGREALEVQMASGIKHKLIGLVLDGPGIIRNHQQVADSEDRKGMVTSGGYSPTLDKSIALARVPIEMKQQCVVEIRHKWVPADMIKLPFVRHGQKMF